MSPRKRRDPPSPISPRRSPKRLRAPPAPWKHTEQHSVAVAGRGPAKERDGKYRVDWADDIITKQSFEPDWQPRKHLNAAALKLWETKKSTGINTSSSRDENRSPPKTPVRPRNPRVTKAPPLHPATRSTTSVQTNGHPKTFNPQKSVKPRPQSQKSIQSVSPSLDTAQFPEVAVQIQPRDDLDKDDYLTYYTASSAPATATLPLDFVDSTEDSTIEGFDPSRTAKQLLGKSVTPEQASTQAESIAQDWSPTQDQTSVYEPSVSSSRSPARVSEILATIPDSQPLPRSPSRPITSSRSTSQARENFATSDTSSNGHQIFPSDSDRIDSSKGYKPPPSRGVKKWVVEELSTQSQSVASEHPQNISPDQPQDLPNHPSDSSPVQVPGSAEKSVLRESEQSRRASEQLVIPQTQEIPGPKVVDSIEGASTPNGSVHFVLPGTMENKATQGQGSTKHADSIGSDKHQEASSPKPESLGEKVLRQLKEAKDATASQMAAADREQRLQSQPSTLSQPSPLKRSDLEIVTGKPNISRSPRGPLSPSLARAALSPKGPLSPSALRSPLEVHVSTPSGAQSPRSIGSPPNIPERLPYQPQEEPSYLGVEPSGIAKDIPMPFQSFRGVTQTQPSDGPMSSQTNTSQPLTTLDIRNIGPMEFVLPLSMPPRTQKQYIETYRFYQKNIQKFLSEKRPDKQLLENLNMLLERVGKVTTHMDLDGGGPSSQEDIDSQDEASYAESCSEKFQVLGYILEATKEDYVHIAVFARHGQLLDFLETFLKSKRINYTRPDSLANSNLEGSAGKSFVSLLASRNENFSSTIRPAHLVIAFDETFDAKNPQVIHVRTHESSPDRLSPVIHFVVYAALEHINLCLSTTLDPVERLRRLVYCMLVTEKFVGQLGPEDFNGLSFHPSAYATQIAEFVRKGGLSSDWLIPNMPPLENIPMMDSDSTLSDAMSDVSEEYKPEGPVRYWPNPIPPKIQKNEPKPGGKRPYELEYGDSLETQAKKLKIGKLAYQRRLKGDFSMPEIDPIDAMREKEQRYQKMEAEIPKLKDQLKEFHETFASRQALFEADRRTIGALRSETTSLQSQLDSKSSDLESTRADLSAQKADNRALQLKLDAQRLDIRTNPIYETTHPHLVIEERLRFAEEQLATKERQLQRQQEDFNFTRQQYQTASSAFVEAQTTISNQEAEIVQLRRKADEVKKHMREVRDRDANGALRKEVTQLREMVRVRDRDIRERETELRELKRGRQGVVTRGSSVQPGASGMRSPRGGSRGVSPAVVAGHGGPAGPPGPGAVPMTRALSALSQRFG